MIPAFQPYNADDKLGNVPVLSAIHDSGSSESRSVAARVSSTDKLNALFPVSRSKVLLVLNQLAVMSQNGVEIAEALGNVTRHCNDKRLQQSLDLIYQSVSSGSTFSQAVASYGTYFPPTLAPMLSAAEATGEVPKTLGKACDRLRGELEMRGTILGAMIYPIILIAASVVVLTALVVGVLPQFSKVFVSMGREVPATTRVLMDFGNICRAYWMWIVPGIIGLLTVSFSYRNHRVIQKPIGKLLMYGPLIRNAYRPLVAGRNFRTIAAMVRGGVPLLQAVRLARRATADEYWQGLLDRVEANLIDGLPASSAMVNVDFLPPEAPQMMATGERTGRVGEVLEDIGAFYEAEGGRGIKRLVVAFEPVIILLMGVVVAAIVMSLMLPLLDVSTIQR